MKQKSVFLWLGILLIFSMILINCSNPKLDENKINYAVDEIKPVQINGKPRFIIGSYHNPKDLDELKILADNGFNSCTARRFKPGTKHFRIGLFGRKKTL